RVSALEQEMQEPGFWDDQERAARVSAEHARTQRKLEGYRELESELDDLEEERLFSGRYDSGDAVVFVHAGTGGTDSQDWAEMLLRMEMRWAERRGFKVELVEVSEGEEAGIKTATFI